MVTLQSHPVMKDATIERGKVMAKIARTNARRSRARQSLPFAPTPGRLPDPDAPYSNSGPAPVDIETAEQTIRYIAELTEQLSDLAGGINEDSLAYFLSMARAEAEIAVLRRKNGK
jgi:hypothetical protein